MHYAMGYQFAIDSELVYDFLLGVGDAINATGQEVVKRKVKAKIVFNKFLVFKIKVTLETGTVMKFKHVEPIKVGARLVLVPPKEALPEGGELDAVKEQLEALGLTKGTKKNPIGFVTE